MARQLPELGTKSPFRLRLGQAIDRFRGVNREADPGAIRDDEFQDAQNIRLTPSGKVVPRGGQSKVNTSAMAGCVEGIFDDEEETIGAKIYSGDDVGTNVVFTYNPFQSPTINIIGDDTLRQVVGIFNGRALFSGVSGGGVYTIRSVARDGTIQTEFTVPDSTIGFLSRRGVELDGSLYLPTQENSVASLVYKWDGITAIVDDTVAVYTSTGGEVVRLDNDLYYLALDPAGVLPSLVRRKSAGVWSTFASIPTTITRIVGYNGTLYAVAPGPPARYYSIGPSGATLLNTVSDALPQNFAVFDNYLYLLYWDTVNERHVIGRFDGVTWNNTYKLAPFTIELGADSASFIIPYDGSLYAIVQSDSSALAIHKSNRSDVTSWSQVATAAFPRAGSAVVAV